MAFIEVRNVSKTYRMGDVVIKAVDEMGFGIEKGEFVVVLGPSGAGKTTILNIIGGMDRATSGTVFVDNEEITKYNEKQLEAFRRDGVGFVFQDFSLIPGLTAIENVKLASDLVKSGLDARNTLIDVGLGNRLGSFPSQLSGGEQQRVAVARAIVKKPKVILCDEPTGALDYMTGKSVLGLLRDTCREHGITVILITHNNAIAPMADKIISIKNGRCDKVLKNEKPVPAEYLEW